MPTQSICSPTFRQTLARLSMVREQVALEKKRVRAFLIDMREKREKEERPGTPPALGAGAVSSIQPTGNDSLAPRLANRSANSPFAASQEEGLVSVGFQEDAENEDEEFDMFDTSSPHLNRKRKVVSNTAQRKKVAIAAELRAVDSYDDAEGYYKVKLTFTVPTLGFANLCRHGSTNSFLFAYFYPYVCENSLICTHDSAFRFWHCVHIFFVSTCLYLLVRVHAFAFTCLEIHLCGAWLF